MKSFLFILTLTLGAALPAPSRANDGNATFLTARASEIDPRAKEHPEIGFVFADANGKPQDVQHAVVDTRVPSQGRLVIWLMGHNQGLFERIASYGLHGIQPHYANRWFSGLGKEHLEDGTSIGKVRLEAATGDDHSPLVDIPHPDGLQERSLQFVRWLSKENPAGHWDQFLTDDQSDLRWDKVILAGISHGSTTAARFAKHQKVARVVMFSGPRDQFESWQGFPSATPANRYFGFSHILDAGWTGDHYCRSWQMLGLAEFGPLVDVDKVSAPLGNSRRLITNSPVNNDPDRAHTTVVPGGSAAKDAAGNYIHEAVWRYLFTHPVDQVGEPVPPDADCRLDLAPADRVVRQVAAAEPELFQQDVADSNDLRVEQANELDAYIHRIEKDRARLQALLPSDYSSPAAFAASAESYRQAFASSIGYPPPGDAPTEEPHFEQIGQDDLGTYYRVMIEVLQGVHAEGIYIVPKGLKGKAPLIISMHGGGGSPEVALFHGGANYHDMVRGGVKRGYIVFAPQHLFSSEGLPRDIRNRTDTRLRLIGTSITAVEIAKITRSLDVLLKRPEVDAERVGMVGLSYGGYYALVTPALDTRIKASVSSCYYGVQEGRYQRDELSVPTDFQFPDRFSLFLDSDIVALICPRALMIQAGSNDDTDHRDPGKLLAPESAEYYKKLGIPDRFEHLIFDGGHEFHDASAWEFIQKHL